MRAEEALLISNSTVEKSLLEVFQKIKELAMDGKCRLILENTVMTEGQRRYMVNLGYGITFLNGKRIGIEWGDY